MTDRRRRDDPILDPVIAMIAEAADTLRRLPRGNGSGPSELRAHWPAFVRDAAESYGYTEASTRPAPPPSDAIDRLDHALALLARIPPPGGRIVWLRANRIGWKPLCEVLRCDRTTAWRKWREAMVELTAMIASGKDVATSERLQRAQHSAR